MHNPVAKVFDMNPQTATENKKWSPLQETRNFFKQAREQFGTTGAILPSSGYLARAICQSLRVERSPWKILEVGPGTGAITREIARVMNKEDHLVAVEINQDFADHLRRDIATKKCYDGVRDQIEVRVGKLEETEGEASFDCIISGLPMNNFDGEMVRTIFQVFRRLLKPGAPLSYYEYLGIRDLKYPFVKKGEKKRLREVSEIVSEEIRKHQVRIRRVWLNIPPAAVRTLVLNPAQ